MNVTFAVLLIFVGLVTAAGIWSINLKNDKWGMVARWGVLIGSIVLLGMFMYSLYYIKGVSYNFLIVFVLALALALVWLFACSMATGLGIIIGVGIYWMVSTFRKSSCREIWAKLKEDFHKDIVHFKAWIDGEE